MTGADSHDENRQQVGVMAQELRQILPDAVHETVSQHYHLLLILYMTLVQSKIGIQI